MKILDVTGHPSLVLAQYKLSAPTTLYAGAIDYHVRTVAVASPKVYRIPTKDLGLDDNVR